MKVIILLSVVIFLLSFNSINSQPKANLEVIITNFESNNGNVRVHLYDICRKKDFPTNSDNVYQFTVGNIKEKKAIVVFRDIPYGIYAVTVHHDANKNIKMDKTIFGLPAEGWGVSNNIKPVLRVPKFEECKFKVDKSEERIYITIRN